MAIDASRPLPPVEPDLDLSGFSWVPLDTAMILKLIENASPDAVKAALALWAKCWREIPASSLPGDEKRIASLIGISAQKWKVVREQAMDGFVLCADGRYYHTLISAQAIIAAKKSLKQRERAKSGWERRQGQSQSALPLGDNLGKVDAGGNANNRSGLVLLPTWIEKEAWDAFEKMRAENKSPLNEDAAKRTIHDLTALRERGQDPNACLWQSVQRGWRGVFEVKDGAAGGKPGGLASRNSDVATRFASKTEGQS